MAFMQLYFGLLLITVVGCAFGTIFHPLQPHDMCAKYSLDSLLNEQYIPVIRLVFADLRIFVPCVLNKILESIQQGISSIPGRHSSTMEDKKVVDVFTKLNKTYLRQVEPLEKELLESWLSFKQANDDFINGKDGGMSFLAAVDQLESVSERVHQTAINATVSAMGPVRNIILASEESLKKVVTLEEEKLKANGTQIQNLTERIREIIKDISPNFLGTVMIDVIEKKPNLTAKKESAESAKTPVTDLYELVKILSGRIKELLTNEMITSRPNYVYSVSRYHINLLWYSASSNMYESGINRHFKSGKNPEEKFKEFWSDEERLASTLIYILETFP